MGNVKTDKIVLKCVEITVSVEDHNGNPVSGYSTDLSIHGASGHYTQKEVLDPNNGSSHTFHVREVRIVSYVNLYGPNHYRTNVKTKFEQSGHYKFILGECKES